MLSGKRPLSLEHLFGLLRELGEEPSSFLANVDADPLYLLQDLFPPVKASRQPAAIRRLKRAAKVLGTGQQEGEPPEPPAPEQIRAWLYQGSLRTRLARVRRPDFRSAVAVQAAAEVLDDLRYDKPPEAARLALEIASEVCPSLPPGESTQEAFSYIVGVFASSNRVTGNLSLAARSLELAYTSATSGRFRGDFFRRFSTFLASCGAYSSALTVTHLSMAEYEVLACPARIGQVFTDRGAINVLARVDDPRTLFEAALSLLKVSDLNHRVTCYQGLAQLAASPSEALGLLNQADSFISTVHGRGFQAWLCGTFLRQAEHFGLAEESLRSANEILWQMNCFDGALCTLDLVQLLLETGRPSEAYAISSKIGRIMEPRASNPLAAGAVAAFFKSRRRSLEAGLLGEVRAALHQSRKLGRSAAWRASA